MGNKNIYERFIWFDQKVKSRGYPNATSLSKEFEISIKTSQRDIEFMRDRLNCPMVYDKSKKGYYYADDTFSLPMVYLSSEELLSLLIAKKMLQDISSGSVAREISSAVDKITCILKKYLVSADVINGGISFQLIEYSPAPEETFKAVLASCIKRRSLTFIYFSPLRNEKTIRTVDPYHLLNYMGTWHLIAYCHERKDLRNFVLARMSDVRLLDDTFTIPKSLDANAYLQSAFGIFKGRQTKQIILRFSPDISKWIAGQVWHRDQKVRRLRDGSLELCFPVANFAEIKMEILKYGSGVEVIRPKVLRDLIREEAKKIARIY
ncbi:MAG: WYL domain-containing protein [Nitrospira sp.]|nr:WYL domain-containing protein [Nitrospira sp.]